jgi:hypothetical protein
MRHGYFFAWILNLLCQILQIRQRSILHPKNDCNDYRSTASGTH